MKKIFCSILMSISVLLTGCNSCTQMTKNFESDIGELDRDIVVLNAFTHDTLFRYSGPCFISTETGSNSVSLIYYVGRSAKKADWFGSGFIFQAVETGATTSSTKF